MKGLKILFMVSMLFLLISPMAAASDFGWVKDFNVRAEADPSGFRVRLGTRFKIGNADIDVVLSNVEKPADAYIACRLGEMSRQPLNTVVERYKNTKGKGWGALAQSLGIKPGSEDFQALKSSQDLYEGFPSKGKDKDKEKNKEKDKDNGKGKR